MMRLLVLVLLLLPDAVHRLLLLLRVEHCLPLLQELILAVLLVELLAELNGWLAHLLLLLLLCRLRLRQIRLTRRLVEIHQVDLGACCRCRSCSHASSFHLLLCLLLDLLLQCRNRWNALRCRSLSASTAPSHIRQANTRRKWDGRVQARIRLRRHSR